MKLSVRLFLGYFLVVAVAGYLALLLMVRVISPGVRTALEASLVDTANLLAELAVADLRRGRIAAGPFGEAIRRYAERPVSAHIFRFPKRSLDYRVYVTDTRGIVLFDSAGQSVGEDFSRWNDVYLTLQGQYGARSSRADEADANSSVMHVAAPVKDGDRLLGVLTVAYPTALLQPIVDESEAQVRRSALWLFGAALAVGALFTWRLTRAIDLLAGYARAVTAGGRATPPRLRSPEMATLAQTLDTMREKLEGRQYAERYVETLTHEMKSPLAAIRGAAELLEEPLPDNDRRRFATHAREQAERLDQLVERLLSLAAVEHRQELSGATAVDLGDLARQVMEEKLLRLEERRLTLRLTLAEGLRVQGESFLLRQALSNLIDNAVAFSPEWGVIEIQGERNEGSVVLRIRDQGSGIPDYALGRLFERFYSLPRPDSGRKSTGLGLAFVREVALLHQGRIDVANRPEGGAEATLTLLAL